MAFSILIKAKSKKLSLKLLVLPLQEKKALFLFCQGLGK